MQKAHVHHHETYAAPTGVRALAGDRSALDHATCLIHRVCCLAGETDLIEEIRADNSAIRSAITDHDTAALFDWLVEALSYQGIADQVAQDFMERHGNATWAGIASDLRRQPTCPKLRSYWHFHDCRYNKSRYTCAEPDHLLGCPLPNHWLRNGRLNQTAYALHLFIRDVADGDLVTVRYRDYPQYPPMVRHRSAVALIGAPAP